MEQRVVAEPNARHNVTCAEGDLLGLRKEFVNGAIEDKLADRLERNKLFWPDFGCIENIEIKIVFIFLCNHLNGESPLGIGTIIDSLVQIFAMEV